MHNYDVIMDLEMMRVATPHIGVEPCAGPKTDVMGFPRVVVECLLALAQHTRGWTAIESVNLHEIGKAVASEPPRALHADGPADAGFEGLLGLSEAVGTHEAPFALGRPSRTARHQRPWCYLFGFHQPPREIRKKKLNVSPNTL